ncbi:MAG TPA: helix-turn-helix transcriptional regulator [Bryobacteraceae bacterium]|nr:helix-turn-helix transcriptional regulator [Bryobacteraceae bacterium]
MDFRQLQDRLIANLRERVRSGELTERGLARLTGISQPHIHNVLKGIRLLSMETADQILQGLDMELLDLIEPQDVVEWRRRQ